MFQETVEVCELEKMGEAGEAPASALSPRHIALYSSIRADGGERMRRQRLCRLSRASTGPEGRQTATDENEGHTDFHIDSG
jgi:hypothetical protein